MTFSEFYDIICGVGIPGILTRLILAVICGGVIGLERETKRRAAGFRTHTLICLGASLTTLVSQYAVIERGLPTDPARLGAQVIAGMSFIGAGAIIVTSRKQVKGLTTAAGLWTSAIIGLAIGAGYYPAAVMAVVLVLGAELLLSKFEDYVVANGRQMTVHVEMNDVGVLSRIISDLTKDGMKVTDVEFSRSGQSVGSLPGALFTVKLKKKLKHEDILFRISETEGVRNVEEV